jgi:hypothetical protein
MQSGGASDFVAAPDVDDDGAEIDFIDEDIDLPGELLPGEACGCRIPPIRCRSLSGNFATFAA